CARNWVFFDYW
nr:immunoglobulin heavy chain junction region [Mus musculus]